MTALNTVIKWACEEIPPWQGDVVRRLLSQDDLEKNDLDEIFVMMKIAHKIQAPTENDPKPKPPLSTEFSGTGKSGDKLILKSVECSKNINALVEGAKLTFGHKGITAIYGENGSGKTGYARVLKRACNARDKKDEVLGNVFDTDATDTPTAKFKVGLDDGTNQYPVWKEGDAVGPEILSKVAVFDSKCARIIINDKNELQYRPYGTDVFEKLVTLINSFKSRLENEKPKPEKPEIANLALEAQGTEFYQNLSAETTMEKIKVFETWHTGDEERLKFLNDWFEKYEKENPEKMIKSLLELRRKYARLINEFRKHSQKLSETKIQKINEKITEFNAAREASKIAEESVSEKDFPLKGVKSDAWRNLFEAAEKYSKIHAYPGKEYPNVEDGARCVLCMQELLAETGAKERMSRFYKFVQDEVGKNLKKVQDVIISLENSFNQYQIRSQENIEDGIGELKEEKPELAAEILKVFSGYAKIIKGLKDAIKNKNEYVGVKIDKLNTAQIFNWLREKKKTIKSLEDALKTEESKELRCEQQELEAEYAIYSKVSDIKKFVQDSKQVKKIETCLSSLNTRSISDKGREIINIESAPALQKNLDMELDFFGVRSLGIKLKFSNPQGTPHHIVELEGAVKPVDNIINILSEGEQKIVALAGFFAELKLADHECPIFFDDPVTSLDHTYQEKIAERLARESQKRQVVFFTHDIAFLMEIEKHVARLDDVCFTPITIRRKNSIPGDVSGNMPWHTMAVKERFQYLESQINEISSSHASDQETYDKEAANWYGHFRETWEAIVEESVLNGTIQRFGRGIKIQSLRQVELEDSEYKTIDIFMTKASEWMTGHDRSKALSAHRPDPRTLRNDLEEARKFNNNVRAKRDTVGGRRKKLLETSVAEVG